MSPDMIKTASEMMSNMPPEELQKMVEMASSLRGKDSAAKGGTSGQHASSSSKVSNFTEAREMNPKVFHLLNYQMFTSMMQNMSPDMIANMNAAKAQQAMSSLSPEDLDKMVCFSLTYAPFNKFSRFSFWYPMKMGFLMEIVTTDEMDG
ncbi:unnamed protein product [Linum tenue]|uniref:Uncharacterized protein n=1 Tax=Linum tenue TaxID=586396 RepID=A0AAV0QBE6_9ROSI|nr:unnamed protein product [Linum tenue]